MFAGVELSTANYDALLKGWSTQSLNSGLFWNEPQLTYCTGESARSILIDDFGWLVSDGGRSSNCPATDIQISSNNIAEQSPVNAVIGTLTSTDENAGDSHTYSLDCSTAGVDDAHFNIVDGSLVVASVLDFEAPVDADSNNSYDICIRSTDSESNTFDKTFSIAVVDRMTALLLEVLEDSSSTSGGGNANGSAITIDDLIEIGGLINLIAANESQYQSIIAAESGFSNPPTVAEVQALIDAANSSVQVLNAVLSSSLSQGNDGSGAPVTAEQLSAITGITDVLPENLSPYQALIATETGFSNPPTVEEIQAIIDAVNEEVYLASMFVTTWNTENVGGFGSSNNTSITIPTEGSGYSYQVDWNNDGDFLDSGEDIEHTGDATHDYGAGNGGEKTIRIKGIFPRVYFNNTGDREKILSVDQWGTNQWVSMGRAFSGASNLAINASDTPDLSGVTDMSFMFSFATAFNQDIGGWDTCLLYTSPSPRDATLSRMPSSA